MQKYYQKFSNLMGIKSNPNDYEKSLFEKTQKYSKYISWIPGLKMIAICNSLSMYATKSNSSVILSEMKQSVAKGNGVEESIKNNNIPYKKEDFKSIDCQASSKGQKEKTGSDIDLFIITASNRIWFVRIAVTIIFQIMGVRRHGKKIKDRFCLSFFITENAIDFSEIAIENDIYLYYWIYYIKPIINKDSTYEKFIKANKNLGIDEINLHPDNKVYQIKGGKYLKFLDKCKILDFNNWALKKIFLPKTLTHKKRLCDPYGIIVSDDILKFTDNDKRKEIRNKIVN